MLLSGDKVPENSTLEADIAVVGAGAAGLTFAREFLEDERKVILLESGDRSPDGETQKLYEGKTSALNYPLTASRTRYFGGSTNCWAGLIGRLDAVDFEQREAVPNSGWPISLTDLIPYYERAETLLEAKPSELSAFSAAPFKPLSFSPNIRTKIYQWRPKRFAKYLSEFERAEKLQLMLRSNLLEVHPSSDGSKIEYLQMKTLSGNSFRVTAERYVLALGAIENARMLLASTTILPSGVGNQNDLVGRYFMEHPHFDDQVKLMAFGDHFEGQVGSTDFFPAIALSEDLVRKEGLRNAAFFPLTLANWEKGGWNKRVGKLAKALRMTDEPSLYPLGIPIEQFPNPESRITLSEERDSLGVPRVDLHWKVSPEDIASMHRSLKILSKEFGASGVGRFQINFKSDTVFNEILGGNHHMGTTRMGTDPTRAVVDPNSRVFGTENLFLLGSSVFPTSGAANPTLTIMALALRLADHVRGNDV